jgi:2-phosphosulfolactate phosphatase
VVRRAEGETVLLVCSGSADAFNLEDFYGAGHLVSHFTRSDLRFELSDSALAAKILHDGSDALDCLSRSRLGRMMLGRGLRREVAYAARKDHLVVVPELRDGRLVAA